MAQLSLFEKRKNYSNKDVSVMIGKSNIIYFTFRNNSWNKFTNSDYIRIWAEKGKLKLVDGEADTEHGKRFKLTKNEQNKDPERCRYVKIVGKTMPDVLEICERINGQSFNLTPNTEAPAKDTKVTSWGFRPTKKLEPVTAEELIREYSPDIKKLTEEALEKPKLILDEDVRRDNFLADDLRLTSTATSTEERTAIYNALAAVYGGYRPKPSKVIPMPKEETEEERKKWEV